MAHVLKSGEKRKGRSVPNLAAAGAEYSFVCFALVHLAKQSSCDVTFRSAKRNRKATEGGKLGNLSLVTDQN